MARIRTIKPEIWTDEDLAEISEPAMLLAMGLLNHADDEGYFRANPALIKAVVFPLREPSVSIHGMLSELSNVGYLTLYKGDDGKRYGLINGFVKHQRINRPTPSKIKALCVFTEDSVSDHGAITEDSPLEQGTGKVKEKTPSESKRKTPDPAVDLSGIDEQAWDDFVQHRESKSALRKGWSALAQVKAANTLRTLTPEQQRRVVDYSIVGGYPGLFPEKANAPHQRDDRSRAQRHHDALRDIAERSIDEEQARASPAQRTA